MAQREKPDPTPSYPIDYIGLKAGYVKPAALAWYASHHHTADGLNQPYQYSYLFAYSMNVGPDERTLKLPNNDKIRILAISVAQENPVLKPAEPLFHRHTQPCCGPPAKNGDLASMNSWLLAPGWCPFSARWTALPRSPGGNFCKITHAVAGVALPASGRIFTLTKRSSSLDPTPHSQWPTMRN